MLTQLFHQNIFIYAMTGVFVLGMIQKLILNHYYRKMANASENMGLATRKPLKNLKTKFENSFKLNMSVNNVDAFVDKNMDKQKLFGISLHTWNKLNWQLFLLGGVIGITGTLYEILNNHSTEKTTMIFAYTALVMLVSLFFEASFGMADKREVLSTNVKDYLDNYLIHRIAENTERKEVMEEENNAEVTEVKSRGMDEDMEYLKKCLNEIASARNIEKQEITKKEEAMLEDVLRDFFL